MKAASPRSSSSPYGPSRAARLAEQLRDALPHIFRPFDRKVWQPFVEHRAARWPLLQALKRGLAARLTLKIVQAENVWDRRDVVRPSLAIDGEQFGASEKRRGRIARCRPVRQNEIDGDQEIGGRRIAGAEHVGEHRLERLAGLDALVRPRFERHQGGLHRE